MSEIFTLRKIIFNIGLIYFRRVTNYLGDKFLMLNKKNWSSYLIFQTFQVLNSINKKQTVFKQKFLWLVILLSLFSRACEISIEFFNARDFNSRTGFLLRVLIK